MAEMKELKSKAVASVAILGTALLIGLLPCSVASAAGTGELLPAGSKAPAFTSVDIDGKPFALEEELTGGAVFLVFWSIF